MGGIRGDQGGRRTHLFWGLSGAALSFLISSLSWAGSDARRFTPVADDEPRVSVELEADGLRCGATVISHEGHILTARHCLTRCLLRSGVFRYKRVLGQLDYLELEPSALGVSRCPARVDGVLQEIVIEATSPGFIAAMDEASFEALWPEGFLAMKEAGYTSRGDFVIARVVRGEALAPLAACTPLSEGGAPSPGEIVWAESYPRATARPDGYNSDGVSAYRVSGTVVSGIRDNACVREARPTPARLERLERSFDEPGAFLSDLDSVYESSGSGVRNARGELVGLLTNMYRHSFLTGLAADEPERRYCAGSAQALSWARVREVVRAVGRAGLLERLRCEVVSAGL